MEVSGGFVEVLLWAELEFVLLLVFEVTGCFWMDCVEP
jgi:hypothetical protein